MTYLPLVVASVLFLLPFVSARAPTHDPLPPATLDAPPQDGRAAFERAWASWAAAPEGPAKEALALEVDRRAGQRYATVSHLYWHRDLQSAIEAAGESGRPILALRMLGNLDEDLSCANSRFFRVVLYANEELSGYLREHFELVWTSERPVPRVTIDFGDGRVLERTVTGNSAHFVLDRHGRPVDVLPGLYGAATFGRLLREAEVVARESAGIDDTALAGRLATHHYGHVLTSWGVPVRLEPVDLGSASPLIAAERTTFGKFRSERSTIVAAGFDPTLTADGAARLQLDLDTQLATAATAVPAELLDASSRSLLARLAPTDWSRPGDPLAVEELEALTSAFEHVLAAEGARNEERLHTAVHAWYAAGRAPRDLASLSAKVYTELFHTAASDPWLGLATPAAFSALPEDGLKLSDEPRN